MKSLTVKEHDIDPQTLLKALENKNGPSSILAGCEVMRGHVLQLTRRKLAIVVVPGIMASRLMREDTMIWDTDDESFMASTFMGLEPQGRQELLLPDPRTPPPLGAEKHRGNVPKGFPLALERGWHTVGWTFYGKLLQSLEEWETPLKALLDMPVYAFGYDWMKSNAVAGKLLCEFINSLDAEKIIIVSHSMGGLVTRSCVGQMADKNKILGVIHGAQPVMGAPAAYRRQKAGFESFSFMDRLMAFVLGKDGPNVRAIFPHGSGPLELLPCCDYKDDAGDGTWFFYDVFVDGKIETRSVPPECIYEDVYKKFDTDLYYGMLSMYFEEGDISTNPDESTQDRIDDAKAFHEELKAKGIHPRTLQIFGGERPTSCTIHWQATDMTDVIMKTKFEALADSNRDMDYDNIRKILPISFVNDSNNYYELRWLEKDWSVGPCIITSRKGKLIYGSNIQHEIMMTGRHVALFNLTGKADKDNTGHWKTAGDGTVPTASAIALPVTDDGWGPLMNFLPRYKGKVATGQVNVSEHTAFFDAHAVKATQEAIHNLCLGWLKGDIA